MIRRILILAVLLGLGAAAMAQTPPAADAPPPAGRMPPPPPPLCAPPHGDRGPRHPHRPPSVDRVARRLHIDTAKARQVRKVLAERMRKQQALDRQTCSALRHIVGAATLKGWSQRLPPRTSARGCGGGHG